jgi:hypothetical protein
VGLVLDKEALEQVFSEYFGFLCQSFHRVFYIHYHPSSGAGTLDQIMANVTIELSLNPLPKEKKKRFLEHK